MNRSLIMAFGAGLASALLFAASSRGAGPALVIAYVTPLPIMIAALGFGQATGLVAAAVATIGTGVFLGVLPGLFFGALLGFPAWWLAYLVLLARPLTVVPGPPAQTLAPMLWYPIGRVVAWAVAIVVAVILAAGELMLLRFGGYDATVTMLADRLQSIVGRDGPGELQGATTAGTIVQLLPVLMSASAFLMLMFNLWLAGRTVERSGLLTRPWPALPENLRLPRIVAAALLIGALLALLTEGAPRVAGGVVAASAGMAFALQGLGAAHALTRGLAARRLILLAIYFITLSVVPSLVALAVLGLVDCLFSLRQRPQPTVLPS